MKVNVINMTPLSNSNSAIKAFFDVEIIEGELEVTIKDIKLVYSEKNKQNFISFPSVKFEKDGKTIYKNLVSINPKEMYQQLSKSIIDYFNGNSVEESSSNNVADDELPF